MHTFQYYCKTAMVFSRGARIDPYRTRHFCFSGGGGGDGGASTPLNGRGTPIPSSVNGDAGEMARGADAIADEIVGDALGCIREAGEADAMEVDTTGAGDEAVAAAQVTPASSPLLLHPLRHSATHSFTHSPTP